MYLPDGTKFAGDNLLTKLAMGAGSMAIIGFWPADMHAFLIAVASAEATIERVFTSVIGPSPTVVPPPDEELLPSPLDEELLPTPSPDEEELLSPPDPGTSDARPKITKCGVASTLLPSTVPFKT